MKNVYLASMQLLLCTGLPKMIYLDHSGILNYWKTLKFGRVYLFALMAVGTKFCQYMRLQNTVSKFSYTISNKWTHTLRMLLSQRSGKHTSKGATIKGMNMGSIFLFFKVASIGIENNFKGHYIENLQKNTPN